MGACNCSMKSNVNGYSPNLKEIRRLMENKTTEEELKDMSFVSSYLPFLF